jgi:translation initiation factor IF-2
VQDHPAGCGVRAGPCTVRLPTGRAETHRAGFHDPEPPEPPRPRLAPRPRRWAPPRAAPDPRVHRPAPAGAAHRGRLPSPGACRCRRRADLLRGRLPHQQLCGGAGERGRALRDGGAGTPRQHRRPPRGPLLAGATRGVLAADASELVRRPGDADPVRARHGGGDAHLPRVARRGGRGASRRPHRGGGRRVGGGDAAPAGDRPPPGGAGDAGGGDVRPAGGARRAPRADPRPHPQPGGAVLGGAGRGDRVPAAPRLQRQLGGGPAAGDRGPAPRGGARLRAGPARQSGGEPGPGDPHHGPLPGPRAADRAGGVPQPAGGGGECAPPGGDRRLAAGGPHGRGVGVGGGDRGGRPSGP